MPSNASPTGPGPDATDQPSDRAAADPETDVRGVLTRFYAAAGAGDRAMQDALWAPPEAAPAPAPARPPAAPGIDLAPPHLRRAFIPTGRPLGAEVYVLGDTAWAVATEAERGGDPGRTLYQFCRVHEQWRLLARFDWRRVPPPEAPATAPAIPAERLPPLRPVARPEALPRTAPRPAPGAPGAAGRAGEDGGRECPGASSARGSPTSALAWC